MPGIEIKAFVIIFIVGGTLVSAVGSSVSVVDYCCRISDI